MTMKCNICNKENTNRNSIYDLEIYNLKKICSQCHMKMIQKNIIIIRNIYDNNIYNLLKKLLYSD